MGFLEKDILKGGVKDLLELKEAVQQWEASEKDLKALDAREKEESKSKEKKQEEIEKEIAAKEKEERKNVAAPFEKELVRLEADKKKKEAERDKKKKEEIQKKQDAETGELREKKNSIHKEIEGIAEADQIPGVGISKLFLALFYPKTSAEVLGVLIIAAILILGLSFASFKLLFGQGTASVFIAICEAFLILFLLLYILLNNAVKEKHLEAFQKINALRREGNKASSEIKKINKQVAKVSEEELGLAEDNKEIDALKEAMNKCKEDKEAALAEFDKDKEGKEARKKEIWNSHEAEWDDIIRKLDATRVELDQKREAVEAQKNALHTNYEALRNVEKNIFKEKTIDELVGIIKQGGAKTIGEAIQKKNEKS